MSDPGPQQDLAPQQLPATPPAVVNANSIAAKAAGYLAGNDTYLAIPQPSGLQEQQQIAQLTMMVNGLMRALYGLLDSTNNT